MEVTLKEITIRDLVRDYKDHDEEGKQSGENDTVKETEVSPEPEKKKHIKKFYRQSIFPARTLESESDIREYLETIEKNLMTLLGDCDGIEIN